jgi:hypothetical protein
LSTPPNDFAHVPICERIAADHPRRKERTRVRSPILRIGAVKVSRFSLPVFSSKTSVMRALITGCSRVLSSKC